MEWADFQKQILHFPAKEQERIKRAFELGKELHDGQYRKSGEPYFMHPVAVAELLIPMGADPDTVIAALLHDTAEDTPSSPEEIGGRFNGDVVQLVDGLTKLRAEDFSEKPRLNEQVETLRKIFSLIEKDVRIMVIKLIDRMHNMRTAEFLSPERRLALAHETMDVYVKIADRLSMQDVRYKLEEYSLAVLDSDLYAQLMNVREENKLKCATIIPLLKNTLQTQHPDLFKRTQIHCEPKPWEKLRAQLEAKGTVVTGLAAVSVAFVCPDRDECYRILGALHEGWRREHLSFQDFINVPVINGYQGLHTTIILNDGTRVRCKIRTEEMERYSHHGVTLFCFQPGREELLASLLPWTKQLSSLTEDTKERSTDFWESLQSDILGETITVYGPNDEADQLPRGATVLDGAFYLFQENALRLRSIKLNGKDVTFNTPLIEGATLDPSFSDTLTVHHTWIQWVQTRVASAMIRGLLAERSEEERVLLGKEMLQRIMSERKQGFIEEFTPAKLEEKSHLLGYNSLQETYLALADGRVQPGEVFNILFGNDNQLNNRAQTGVVRYNMNLMDNDQMDRLIRVHRKYLGTVSDIRYTQNRNGSGQTRIRVSLPPTTQQEFLQELRRAGGKNVSITSAYSSIRFIAGMAVLILLWGIDPVVAHFLLGQFAIGANDLSIIRFWSLTALSGAILLWTRFRHPLAQAPLPLRNTSLWLSVLLLTGVSLSTYTALQTTLPSHYTILMTAAGIVLTSIVKRRHWGILFGTWSLFLLGLFALVEGTPGWSIQSITSTLLAVTLFTAFSIVSERYKRQEHVEIRAAQYFFFLSVICAVLSLPLFPFSHLATLSLSTLAAIVAFSLVFVGLPYYMYYEMLSHKQIDYVLRYSFLIIPATFLGQLLLGGSLSLPAILAGGLVIVGASLPLLVP